MMELYSALFGVAVGLALVAGGLAIVAAAANRRAQKRRKEAERIDREYFAEMKARRRMRRASTCQDRGREVVNEKLIEEARGESERYYTVPDDVDHALARAGFVRGYIVATEKAHTPTDDEREATETAIRLSLRFDLGWSPDEARTLGAVLAEPVATRITGFRRTEAPEPSAEPLRDHQDDELTRERDHHGIDPEPKGEPSDAQVLAAVDAFMASQLESEDGPSLVHKNMAAALRAAGVGGVR